MSHLIKIVTLRPTALVTMSSFVTNLHVSLPTLKQLANELYHTTHIIQIGTNKAMEWLSNNRLLVNNEKSTCMLLGTRQRISNMSLDIHVGDNFLNSSNEIKLLGMVFDNCLSYDEQISYICKKVAPKLGILYRLSKFLSADILNIIYFYHCSF